ncbi:B3/4 domain-containing protein [Kitasatospora sp. NPDC050543]|uniref:B3/4 domain-containing protein n=1 Tax=Kitasatospora sp. NPDC050543 TaxID=3364054 RepID=UPI0037985E59
MSLHVEISPEVFAAAPDYLLALVAVPAIEVRDADSGVEALLTAAEDRLHAAGLDRPGVAALPQIAAWRAAYQAVGISASRFPCAAESVLRRVAKGGRLPRINTLVDLCNALSLESRLPVAAFSLEHVGPALTIRRATGGEPFAPLGGGGVTEPVESGEVIYADGEGRAHSRRWNWRQGDLAKTLAGERRLLLTVESAHPGGPAEVEPAVRRLAAEVARLTGAAGSAGSVGEPVLLSAQRPGVRVFSDAVPAGAR